MRTKGLLFICKGPNHSCLSDAGEMIEVEQEEIPFDFQGEDSSLDESMGSYDDTSEEHEQSFGVEISSPDVQPCVVEEYDKQLIVPMREGDLRADEQLMIQHREHIEKHETNGTHSVQDGPMLESQLVAHVVSMMEDEQTPLGLAIGVEQIDVQAASMEAIFTDTCP